MSTAVTRLRRFGALAGVVVAFMLAGCGGDDDGGGNGDFEFSAEGQEQWVENWCDLEIGMSRDDVIDLMGEPTQEFDAETGYEPQSQWGNGFTVFYDSAGAADSLQANELSLDDTTISQLDCDLTRQR